MTGTRTQHRAGDRSVLIDLPSSSVLAVTTELRSGHWAARLESVIPTSATLLVTARRQDDLPELQGYLDGVLDDLSEGIPSLSGQRTITVPVIYDGPDLDDVARLCGLSPSQVVRAHTEAHHVVAYFGFAPGFAYIDGVPADLQLPRRDTPRTNIPAGTVAIAANQSVVYPGGTPGGWHLIGRTTTRLWDLEENPPAKFATGDRIIFEATGESS
jgi:KipI family sensor histidine kinase inhibitor